MNILVAHIVSGFSFFTGAGAVVLGLMVQQRTPHKGRRFRSTVLTTLGLLLAMLSGIPGSNVVCTILIVLTLACCSRRLRVVFPRLVLLCCSCWLLAVVGESQWFLTPGIAAGHVEDGTAIIILADSMTAGLGEGEAQTWPTLLAKDYRGPIFDLSHVGETFNSAQKRIRHHSLPEEAIVFIELGGNDLLGTTTLQQYSKDVEALLTSVSGDKRQVYMFELPLIPFHNAWGETQRNLATRYNVKLIPKHRLISVIVGESSTLDSIHLSQTGHQRMLTVVCDVLGIPVGRRGEIPHPTS